MMISLFEAQKWNKNEVMFSGVLSGVTSGGSFPAARTKENISRIH